MSKKPIDFSRLRAETRLVASAREFTEFGIVNPPVYHASTILFPTVEALRDRTQPYRYGRRGTPTSRALETAVARLEGGHDARVCGSGLAAVTTTLLAYVKAGDHLLVTDAVYGPARHFCDTLLKGYGVEVTYYDPRIGAKIDTLFRPNTRLVYTESPGSQTFEVQDIPAIAAAARQRGIRVAIDNTWSGGYFFDAFRHGCDVSLQAGTKYIGGHSDLMLGTITCTESAWDQLAEAFGTLGQCAGPDDVYLALRGLRTIDVRLARHQENGLVVAEWLKGRPEVERVVHPALPDHPDHAVWKRDFSGASGLFSVILKTTSVPAMSAMLNGLELFGMGHSWGGYESLVVPFDPSAGRTIAPWQSKGLALRFHIGLEHPDDLKADLAAGFERLSRHA
jgi:cystathionine beta-lyase